jgi:L-iditol 2-dehydrogenase
VADGRPKVGLVQSTQLDSRDGAPYVTRQVDAMLAVVKTAPGQGHIEVKEVAVPHPGVGEIRVAVLAAGICGTDLHIEDDEFPTAPPVVLGHEVSGIVDEIGAGVAPDRIGHRVALETYASTCGTCEFCRTGSNNLCSGRLSIGSRVNGGFARFVVVPARNAHLVDVSVSEPAGALYEPLACVAHALCDPPVASPGDEALVVGPGPIGLLAAQILRAEGAAVTVVGAERDAVRLRAAAGLGFVSVTADRLDPAVPEGGFQVVAECSGSEAGVGLALRAVRRRGRFIQIGLAGHAIKIELDTVCYKEIQLTSGNASTPRSWERAGRLVAAGSVVLDELVSATLPLTRWHEAFARARSGDCLKLTLSPTV